MEEMKPCPFCGSKDIRFVYITGNQCWCAVQCQNCFAEFRGNFMYCNNGIEFTRKKLEERWNKRENENG